MSRTSPQAAATPSGVMASRASRPPLADTDETARERLEKAFRDWGEAIGAALTRLRDNGLLPVDADLPALTTATLASLQGGLLLSKTARDSQPLRIALHAAISYLKHLPPGKRLLLRRERAGSFAVTPPVTAATGGGGWTAW